MGIDPNSPMGRKILEAVADGRATEGPRAVLPDESAAAADPPTEMNRLVQGLIKEAAFQKMVISHAQACGWVVAHFRKVRVQRADGRTFWETPVAADGKGFLDLEMVRDTRIIKAELKIHPNKPTPDQEWWIAAYKLLSPRLEVYVWYPEDWPFILEVLR